MSEGTKETAVVGQPGQSHATVTKERKKTAGDPTAREARRMLKKAGEELKPYNCTHTGSAAFHIYVDKSSTAAKPVHVFVCQTLVEECEEHEADFAYKQLKDALMEAYGRRLPKLRNL